MTTTNLAYMTGFANEHASEAIPGALPIGRNSPQAPPLGLYPEKLSGTAFTAPKATNARTWFYRIRPSVTQHGFKPFGGDTLLGIADDAPITPEPLRWSPLPVDDDGDLIDGLSPMAVGGDLFTQTGMALYVYRATRPMESRFFHSTDGEWLIVPEQGDLRIHTECGVLDVAPESIALIPRGMKFRVTLPTGPARGYICENFGARFELPERGPIGSDGLANARDFEFPVAAFEDRSGPFELIVKQGGRLFRAAIDHSPLDAVAWHGNLAPWRYDLNRFNVMGSISYDHPDPSIFTVLTSRSDTPGVANVDFVVFAPRWLVSEDTFRPPWYHRNVMSEFMGLISGLYDAKPGGGFVPGGMSLHNGMIPHGPDPTAFEGATDRTLQPEFIANSMAFMFETRFLLRPTHFAMAAPELQQDYAASWAALRRLFRA